MSDSPWYTRPVVALDLETTGLDVRTNRPVTVAMARVLPNSSVQHRRAFLVNPGIPVPAEATAINGITDERAARDGARLPDVLAWLVTAIQKTADRGEPLVIMNARYDWSMLHHAMASHALALPPIPILDPSLLDRELDKWRKGSRRLADLAVTYGSRLDPTEAHTATGDAVMAARVMFAIARDYPTRLHQPLEALHAWQAELHERHRLDRMAYWQSIGKPTTVSPGWPLETVPVSA